MRTAIQALTVLLPILYLGSAVLHGMAFAGDKAPPVGRARRVVLFATLILHFSLFALYYGAAGGVPLLNTWLVVSLVAFTVAVLWTGITLRSPQPSAGAIVLGMVGALQLAASAFGPVSGLPASPDANAFRLLHVTTTILASGALILSGTYGLLHLLLYRQMQQRRFGPVFKQLPNLEQLARTTRRAALAGFLFLTAGLNVGIAMGHSLLADFHYTDPQVILTLALWVHFGLIAFSRTIRGLTARRASVAALCGLVTVIVLLLLMLVPGASFHRLG